MRNTLPPLILLLLLAEPSQAATTFTADLAADQVDIPPGSLQGEAALIGMLGTPDRRLQMMRFTAEEAEVIVHEKRGAFLVASPGSYESAPYWFSGASGLSVDVGYTSYLTVAGEGPAKPVRFDGVHGGVEVSVANEPTFAQLQGPLDDLPDVSRLDDAGPYPEVVVPGDNLLFGVEGNGVLSATGEVSLHIYGINFTVMDSAGRATLFRTGFEGGNELGGISTTFVERWAIVTLTNATVDLFPGAAQLQVYGTQVGGVVSGAVRLSGVEGRLGQDGEDRNVRAGSLVLEADRAALSMAPGTTSGGGLAIGAHFNGVVDRLTLDGRSQELAGSTQVADPQVPIWVVALAAAATLAAVAAWLLVRRGSSLAIEFQVLKAEEEMGRGNVKRAIRLAERALAKVPDDTDLLALRAVGLMRLKRPADAIRLVDDALLRNSPEPQTLHLLMAMARLDQGEEEPARESLRRAIELDPSLATASEVVGLQKRLRMMRTSTDSSSYV